jgi:hypothetical protein
MIRTENSHESGEFLMLDKKERRLIEAILRKTLKSRTGRQVLEEILGREYVEIGLKLLRQMTGLTADRGQVK